MYSIYFLFHSTTKPIVTEAFTKMSVQGFFQKSFDMEVQSLESTAE
jgi:hypothetical protein